MKIKDVECTGCIYMNGFNTRDPVIRGNKCFFVNCQPGLRFLKPFIITVGNRFHAARMIKEVVMVEETYNYRQVRDDKLYEFLWDLMIIDENGKHIPGDHHNLKKIEKCGIQHCRILYKFSPIQQARNENRFLDLLTDILPCSKRKDRDELDIFTCLNHGRTLDAKQLSEIFKFCKTIK